MAETFRTIFFGIHFVSFRTKTNDVVRKIEKNRVAKIAIFFKRSIYWVNFENDTKLIFTLPIWTLTEKGQQIQKIVMQSKVPKNLLGAENRSIGIENQESAIPEQWIVGRKLIWKKISKKRSWFILAALKHWKSCLVNNFSRISNFSRFCIFCRFSSMD